MRTKVLLALLLFIGLATADAGLVGYWKCDENNGTAVLDSSGNGLTGTIYNATNWTTGKNYQTPYALKYDGTGQYVSLPNVALLNVSNVSFTISAWVNPTSETAANTILGKVNTGIWYPGTVFYIASVAPAGRLTLSIYNSSTTGFDILTINIIPTNKWTHVAVTWNTTHACFYINGVLDAGGCQAGTIPLNPNNIYAWYIGNVGQKNIGFNGTIDDVAIYNESKSASWVMSDYLKYCPLGLTNIITYNESSTSQSVTFGITASNTTSSFSYSPFTDYYCNSSFPTGSATISISNTSFYSPRYYYQTLTYGGNYNLSAYLLPLNAQYPITTSFVILSGNSIVTNALVTVQRQISGSWTTIAQKYTDSSGAASFNLDYQTPYYIITTATGYASRYDTLTPTSTIYYLSLIGTSTSVPFWQYYNQYTAGCTVTNETYPAILIDCFLNDTSGHLTNTYLSAKSIGTYGSISLCDNTTTPNNTVSCFIAAPGELTIYYTLAAKTSSDPGYVTVFSDILSYLTTSNFQNYGIMPAFILVFTLGFAGVMLSPASGVIGAIAGVWLSSIMQLVTISPAGLMGLTVVGVILVYELKV